MAVNKKSLKNLKSFDSNQDREKASINGKKGGKRSGEVKRAKKTMKEMLDYLLEKEITNSKGEKASTLEAISVAIIKKAMIGDTKAYEVIRDTIGQKLTDKLEVIGQVQKVYVTKEDEEAVEQHIKDMIDG